MSEWDLPPEWDALLADPTVQLPGDDLAAQALLDWMVSEIEAGRASVAGAAQTVGADPTELGQELLRRGITP